jgi:hypothetical protein
MADGESRQRNTSNRLPQAGVLTGPLGPADLDALRREWRRTSELSDCSIEGQVAIWFLTFINRSGLWLHTAPTAVSAGGEVRASILPALHFNGDS